MHFIKRFYGVKAGEIYPVWFEPGQECPPELEPAAIAEGAVSVEDPAAIAGGAPAAKKTAAKTKAEKANDATADD